MNSKSPKTTAAIETIMASEIYQSGTGFMYQDIRAIMEAAGMSQDKTRLLQILSAMRDAGKLMAKTTKANTHIYSKPAKSINSMPWRQTKDSVIGVKSQHCGSLYQWAK